MDRPLLQLTTDALFRKFGAGGHKPGSGSAAALQGMLSAQLIKTVITLTADPKRKNQYAAALPQLAQIKTRINRVIYPALEKLFYDDAIQFDKLIKCRQLHNAESNNKIKRVLFQDVLIKTKPVTEIPIAIANYCTELAGFAALVFDKGFRAARGDSGLALDSAIAALSGCIFIIDLNLLAFESDLWTKGIRSKLLILRSKFDTLTIESRLKHEDLKKESERKDRYSSRLAQIAGFKNGRTAIRDSEIEDLAIKMQRFIWAYGDIHWKGAMPTNPIEALDPKVAFRILKYEINTVPALGQHDVAGAFSEVAGQIDQSEKEVWISEKFTIPTKAFTLAHELGHALLHRQPQLHRDLPLEVAGTRKSKNSLEHQADKFATYYLMPKKHVLSVFSQIFECNRFILNDDTAYALNKGLFIKLRGECKNKRGLSRLLASTERYNYVAFESIADRFKVSIEAMAIRLEELDLVEY